MPELQVSNLKVNIPGEVISDYESLAVERNDNLEGVLSKALVEYINNLGPLPPEADFIIEKLRSIQLELNELGIVHLALFGSVARGESKRGSDIDLLIDFHDAGVLEWSNSGKIKRLIGSAIDSQCEIELIPRHYLKSNMRNLILSDAIEIF